MTALFNMSGYLIEIHEKEHLNITNMNPLCSKSKHLVDCHKYSKALGVLASLQIELDNGQNNNI